MVNEQQALMESIAVSLSFTDVKASVSGYVGRLPKKVGALVSSADAEALTTLSEVNEVYAYFSLTEKDNLNINRSTTSGTIQEKLKSFDQVQLQLADGSVYPIPGKIDMMDGLEQQLDPNVFFRANRQFIIAMDSIQSIHKHFNDKGKIVLKNNLKAEIMLSRQRFTEFKQWLDR